MVRSRNDTFSALHSVAEQTMSNEAFQDMLTIQLTHLFITEPSGVPGIKDAYAFSTDQELSSSAAI